MSNCLTRRIAMIVALGIGGVLCATFLTNLWINVKPSSSTLCTWGHKLHLSWLLCWAWFPIILIQLPTWGVAIFLGLLIGKKRRNSWLCDATASSASYMLAPWIIEFVTGAPFGTWFWPWGNLRLFALDVPAVPLMVCAAWLMARRSSEEQNRHPDHEYCQVCGYDLFGLQGDRCPECGSPHRVPHDSR